MLTPPQERLCTPFQDNGLISSACIFWEVQTEGVGGWMGLRGVLLQAFGPGVTFPLIHPRFARLCLL